MNEELIEKVVLLTALWERDTIVRAIPHSVAKEIIALVSAHNHQAVKDAVIEEELGVECNQYDSGYSQAIKDCLRDIEDVFNPKDEE